MLRDAAVPHAPLQQPQASWPENLAMQVVTLPVLPYVMFKLSL